MRENILDYILADPSFSLYEAVDIIDFHMEGAEEEKIAEIKEDLKHAFNT